MMTMTKKTLPPKSTRRGNGTSAVDGTCERCGALLSQRVPLELARVEPKAKIDGPWHCARVSREDAGGELYGVVRYVNGQPIEHDLIVPSYDRAAMQRAADLANEKAVRS
jgi:hypothetical protein